MIRDVLRMRDWGRTLAGLLVAVCLPLAMHWARGHPEPGCELDGGRVDPLYRVVIVDGRGVSHVFCCLRCARIWLDREPTPPRSIMVTDEASGQPLNAEMAYFVRSSVVTMPTTRNRVHAFRNRADAEKHAATFAGIVLSRSEGPFYRERVSHTASEEVLPR